eukprot:6430918-Lingulodinium_polyedra.AAC.1
MARGASSKAPGSSAGKAAPSKACGPAGQGKSDKGKSAEQVANQKVYDNLRDLSVFCREIKVDEKTGLTCAGQVLKDVLAQREGKTRTFGK